MPDLQNFGDWPLYALSDIAHYHNGFAFKPKDWSEDGVRIIRIEQLNNPDGPYDRFTGTYPSINHIDDGDLIFSWSATLKVLIWKHGSCVLNQHLFRVDEKEGFDKQYIYYILDYHMDSLAGSSHGSTMKHIKRGELQKYRVPIPSPNKQKKIAIILQTIDRAIAHTEALIEKYHQIKAGLMHDLFTRGIGADGKLRPTREEAPELYQESAIGWIPREWQASCLKDILRDSGGYLQTGPFGSQLHAHEYTFEGIPFVMPQNINNGKIDEKDIARIIEKRAQSLLRHRLKIGDIIIARRGDLSRAAAIGELEQGWVCGSGCFLLRLGGSNLDARFFSLMYRHSIVQRQVEGLAVGSTMSSLNNEIMGKLVFPCMSETEQRAIADKVALAEAKITTLELELAKLQKQKSGLMQDLLTGKVPVKVDTDEVDHV